MPDVLPDLTQAPRSPAVNQRLAQLNRNPTQALSRYQRKQIVDAAPLFIYNVSSTWEWPMQQQQLGLILIKRRPANAEVSEAVILPGAVVRWFQKAYRREAMIEEGISVAEDITGSSSQFPAENLNSNLTRFGVFISEKPYYPIVDPQRRDFIERVHSMSEGLTQAEWSQALKKLEDRLDYVMPAKKQAELTLAAREKLLLRLQAKILEGDTWWATTPTPGQPNYKNMIDHMHRLALVEYNELTGQREQKPWAPIDKQERVENCKFCGHGNKVGVAKCANCHEVINQELYEKLKAGK